MLITVITDHTHTHAHTSHTCTKIHTYIHTYIQKYVHTYIHMYIHTHAYIQQHQVKTKLKHTINTPTLYIRLLHFNPHRVKAI